MKGRVALHVALPLVGILAGFVVAWVADAPRRDRYERYALIHEGMTEDEVDELLGPSEITSVVGNVMVRREVVAYWGDGLDFEFGTYARSGRVYEVFYFDRDPIRDPIRDRVERLRKWLGL